MNATHEMEMENVTFLSTDFVRLATIATHNLSVQEQIFQFCEGQNRMCFNLMCTLDGYKYTPYCCNLVEADRKRPCEDEMVSRQLYLFVYPVLLVMCCLGNTINAVIYSHGYFKRAATIQMLIAKSITNIVYICITFPHFLKAIAPDNQVVIGTFWQWHPWILFIGNSLVNYSTWLTVLMTVDTYAMIARPYNVDALVWRRYPRIFMAILAGASASCHVFSVVGYKVQVETLKCGIRKYQLKSGPHYLRYERIHSLAVGVSNQILPMVILISLAAFITTRLYCNRRIASNALNSRKLCIASLIYATVVAHIVFEMPNALFYILQAIGGSGTSVVKSVLSNPFNQSVLNQHQSISSISICTIITTFNFLSHIHATVPFIMYAACNSRFRTLLKRRLLCKAAGDAVLEQDHTAVPQTDTTHSHPTRSKSARSPRTLSISPQQSPRETSGSKRAPYNRRHTRERIQDARRHLSDSVVKYWTVKMPTRSGKRENTRCKFASMKVIHEPDPSYEQADLECDIKFDVNDVLL